MDETLIVNFLFPSVAIQNLSLRFSCRNSPSALNNRLTSTMIREGFNIFTYLGKGLTPPFPILKRTIKKCSIKAKKWVQTFAKENIMNPP